MRKIIFKREVFLSIGSASKWSGDICITPKFGRNWFVWLPHLQWNKGVPFRHAVTDLSISWLFYWSGITVYWFVYIHDGSQSSQLASKVTPNQ